MRAASQLYLGSTVGELVLAAIRRYGDRPAVVWRGGHLSYRALGEKISRLVQAFKQLGLKPGSGVAQLTGNRPETICVMLAANVMGLRYTPLHPLGSVDDHVFILNDAEISVVVVDTVKFEGRSEAFRARVPCLQHLLTLGDEASGDDLLSLLCALEATPLEIEADARDIAWIAYTGGTTGKPKGVVLPHRSMVTNVQMALADWDWPPEVRFLAVTPVSHATGVMVPPVLLQGGTFHLADGYSPRGFLETVQAQRITTTFMVPTMIYALLDFAKLKDYDISSLETIIYGAASISPTRLGEALDTLGPVFMQLYGQTEAPNTITVLKKADHDKIQPQRLSSCGVPTVGNRVCLLDNDNAEVDAGEVGEICVRGPLVMDGYWRREQETAEVLQGEWLHTGDMARRDEQGFLYIVDRKKDLIISGGFNVFPREIEDVLSTHPAISAVSVIGVPDDKWGEAVTAVIVLRPGQSLDADEVKALVKDRKGSIYAPKTVRFIDELPETALGKPDKKALRNMFS